MIFGKHSPRRKSLCRLFAVFASMLTISCCAAIPSSRNVRTTDFDRLDRWTQQIASKEQEREEARVAAAELDAAAAVTDALCRYAVQDDYGGLVFKSFCAIETRSIYLKHEGFKKKHSKYKAFLSPRVVKYAKYGKQIKSATFGKTFCEVDKKGNFITHQGLGDASAAATYMAAKSNPRPAPIAAISSIDKNGSKPTTLRHRLRDLSNYALNSVLPRKAVADERASILGSYQAPEFITKTWGYAKKVAPGMAACMAVSFGTKVVLGTLCSTIFTQFGIAAAAATLPALASTVVIPVAAAAAIGGIAGGLAGIARIACFKENRQEKDWAWAAFKKGLLWGVVGSLGLATATGIAAALSNVFSQGSFFHDLLFSSPAGASQIVQHASAQDYGGIARHFAPKELLSTAEFKSLPPELRALSKSHNARSIVSFCKRASAEMFNHGHNKVGASLVKRGLEIAEHANVHTHTVEQLNADAAYINFRGLGTSKNIAAAVEHAKLAGHAVNDYGHRMLALVRSSASLRFAAACPSPR